MTTRATRSSKAATATNGHTLTQKPANIAIDQGCGLAEVAAQLADLEGLYTLTIHAKWAADKEAQSVAGVYTGEEIAASNAAGLFNNVNKRAHAITDTLQDLLLQMEPHTLDETLSLMLVYNQQMAAFFNDLREDHSFTIPEAL